MSTILEVQKEAYDELVAKTSGINTGDQDLSGLEPAIIKKEAFNKDFGSGTNEVCKGDDERLNKPYIISDPSVGDIPGLPITNGIICTQAAYDAGNPQPGVMYIRMINE